MSDDTPSTPAGWYPVGSEQRYWDGTAWTEHTAPLSSEGSPPGRSDRKAEKAARREAEANAKAEARAQAEAAKEARRAEEQAEKEAGGAAEVGADVPEDIEPSKPAKADVRPDIALAMSKMSHKMGSKREIKRLPEHLWEDETVDLLTGGTYGSGTGVLVLTDRRLLFLKDGMMSKTSEDFPLEKISSIQWSTGMLLGKITVFASGNKAEIVNVQKLDGKAITDAVRARTTGGSRPNEPATATPTPSLPGADVLDQLRKLGELRDAGVLTDEEFAAKKQRLLDQI
jgi:hypothetical protein